MAKPLITNTACHLVTGFLGAGKTSFINACIDQLMAQSRWAILINEAGKIGIDAALFDNSNDNRSALAIREVNGGCICCTSQLPLQIALARLLADHHPERLWIEPTGLAHPETLTKSLSAPHWQTALTLKTVFCVLNGRQWQQPKYRQHAGYQAHVQFCDAVIINRYDTLSVIERDDLIAWTKNINPHVSLIWQSDNGFDDTYATTISTLLDKPSHILTNDKTTQLIADNLPPYPSNLTPAITKEPITQDQTQTTSILPYHYHDEYPDAALPYQVMGWRLPADWYVSFKKLLEWLLALPHWQRIKGVFHTDKGWYQLNFTHDAIDKVVCSPYTDNRLEIIFLNSSTDAGEHTSAIAFQSLDKELMALFTSAKDKY